MRLRGDLTFSDNRNREQIKKWACRFGGDWHSPTAINSYTCYLINSSMPLDLPDQPNGPTHLPVEPQDPPSLVDIRNSVVYSQRILTSHRAELLYY